MFVASRQSAGGYRECHEDACSQLSLSRCDTIDGGQRVLDRSVDCQLLSLRTGFRNFFFFGCGGLLGEGNTIIAVTSQHISVKYFEGGYIISSLSFILIDGVEKLFSWKSCKPSKHEVYKCISQNLRRRSILGKTWRCKDEKTWCTRCCHPQELDWDVHSRLPTVSLPTTSQERWCVKNLGFEDVRKWDVVT